MPLIANKAFQLQIAKDNLTAVILPSKNESAAVPSVEVLEQEIKAAGISPLADLSVHLEAYLEEIGKGSTVKPLVVARGTPPEHDKPGRIENLVKPDDEFDENDKVSTQSHYERSSVVQVQPEQALLRLISPVDGKDGVDVCGKPIARKLASKPEVKLGPNVRRSEDLVVADCLGVFEYENSRVSVREQLDIPGNVDFSVGNVDYQGDIQIGGNILDLFEVSSKGSVTVHGVIEAAVVDVESDLIVNGGIAGKDKGIVRVGGNVSAKYISNANLTVAGNVSAHKTIMQAELVCEGRITSDHASLVGGTVRALGGIIIKELGSDANVPTTVEIGIEPKLAELCPAVAAKVDACIAKSQKIKQMVDPLLANLKRLSPEQKEKATELSFQAEELIDTCRDDLEQLCELIERTQERSKPEITVQGVLYPGVTIRFPRVEVTITEPLKGPIRIAPEVKALSWHVFATEVNSEHSVNLVARPDGQDHWDTMDRMLEARKQLS